MDDFDVCWDVLAEQGMCDARGSMEYQRIRDRWDYRDQMLTAMLYILTKANERPPPIRDATTDKPY